MPEKAEPMTGSSTLRAGTTASPGRPLPPRMFPVWVGWLVLALLAMGVLAAVLRARGAAVRAWKQFAEEIGGTFVSKSATEPAHIIGNIAGRPFTLETALSYEDDAPYYHTCASMPIKNPSGLIVGLRRKSLLEEAQTRGKSSHSQSGQEYAFDLSDKEFEGRFFLVTNSAEHLITLLTPEHRRELLNYSDVEVYLRWDRIEWRRAGAVSDLRVLQRLTTMLREMAEATDRLPSRSFTLSEQMADEALIAKGI